MPERRQSPVRWIDFLWILLLLALALLPPINEIHKQLILLAIAVLQLFERTLIDWLPGRGRIYSVLLKILLCTLLLLHTDEIFPINSAYYPIYFIPVITAAVEFGTIATLLWTTLASIAYCSLLLPDLPTLKTENEITPENAAYLALRILFFYIAAILVNRFAVANRRQVQKSQELLAALEETNRQLRRAEAEARRSERLAALGQLSAGLAHEIRNPLGVIKGSAEMLMQKLQGQQPLTAELAGYISSEVNRLNALVARFLDFARPQHIELSRVSISEIVDRSLEAVQNQYPSERVTIEKNYAATLPEILADPQLCEQVFINLFTNAFQAMSPNGDATRGSTAKNSQSAKWLSRQAILRVTVQSDAGAAKPGISIVVEDTGPGVPPELREQIFNPFFTSKKDGVGLGLAIVAKIVDDHRGSIRLDSESAGGARFRIFLPIDPNA